MRRMLCLILVCLAASVQARNGIPRWDALPAIDVLHLQGRYTGQRVCPMCRHGYDAGLLVFLPSSITESDADRIARSLRTAAAEIEDDRFRSFLILTGETPSDAVLSALRSVDTELFVAHLPFRDLPDASRDFQYPLDGRAYGYVFAQRRLLWAFAPNASDRSRTEELTTHSRYAMTLLRSTYAHVAASDDPDTPKGRLWTAPAQLSSAIEFAKAPGAAETRVCFVDQGDSMQADALVALSHDSPPSPERTRWARTDAAGCLALHGIPEARQIRAEVFASLEPATMTRFDTSELQSDRPLMLRVQSIENPGVTGSEPIVGLPCEGCEAVFQDLPTRLDASARLALDTEPGEPLLLSGTLRTRDGQPQPGIIVYAYQTDGTGNYPADPRLSGAAARHGRLRGWARTDASGRYAFHTIRPGGYPGENLPQHIHLHIIEPGRCTYYVGDVLFADDPRLTFASRAKQDKARGGSGIVQAKRDARAGWKATRDVALGLNVPGYDGCSDAAVHAEAN